jgi:hypothetical protein
MNLTKIKKPSDTPIAPCDIDAKHHFWEAFGNCESEVSARWLVTLAQEAGSWQPFTIEDIERFYRARGFRRFLFNGISEWLIKDNGQYYYTIEFVAQCYASSPGGKQQ